MRFLDKFDLQDLVTAGPLKVYEALESQTGLRRLVQILEWKEVPVDVSTLQILEHFGQTAPEPPGIIVDAGRVEKTNQIYLVTSFPDDRSSVERWINTYLAKSKAESPRPTAIFSPPTTSLPVTPGATPAGKGREGAESAPSWSRHEPGAFTKEFLALLDGAGKAPAEKPELPDTQATKAPGAFTREFLSLSSNIKEVPDKPPLGSPAEPPGLLADAEGPAPAAPAQAPIPGKKTGEFTRFFRAYTDAPSKAPAPPLSPTSEVFGPSEQESGHGPRGEFTNFFGPGKSAPSEMRQGPMAPTDFRPEESPAAPRFDYNSAPPLFTSRDSITQREPAMPPPNVSAPRPAFLEPAWDGQSPAGSDSTSRNTSPPRPQVESQVPRRNSFEPNWEESRPGDTKQVIPARTQEPPPAAAPEGPSEFTRIISSASLRAAPPSPSPPVAPPTAAPSIQAPSIQAPSIQPNFAAVAPPPVPAPPAVPTPAAPQVPSTPSLPAVQSPALPPPAPPAPQPSTPPAPKLVSYLPLIITLNVLLAVVVTIVLYFALKSHH